MGEQEAFDLLLRALVGLFVGVPVGGLCAYIVADVSLSRKEREAFAALDAAIERAAPPT